MSKNTPMNRLQRYRVMQLVEKADRSTPDIELARSASELIGRPVAQGVIAEYRSDFGIPSVKAPKPADLRQRVLELEDMLKRERSAKAPGSELVAPGVPRAVAELPPVGAAQVAAVQSGEVNQ